MRELLEKWSKLEPHLCKRETRPNWHEEFEDYYIKDNQIGWQIVYFDGHNNLSDTIKKEAPAKIQWAVQQAIIEKGWYFLIHYNHEYYSIEMGPNQPSPRFTKGGKNLAECLLVTYLVELESSANP